MNTPSCVCQQIKNYQVNFVFCTSIFHLNNICITMQPKFLVNIILNETKTLNLKKYLLFEIVILKLLELVSVVLF